MTTVTPPDDGFEAAAPDAPIAPPPEAEGPAFAEVTDADLKDYFDAIGDPPEDEFLQCGRAESDGADSDADDADESDDSEADSDSSTTTSNQSAAAWTNIVKPSRVDPIDVLPESDGLGLFEYLQQAPTAPLPTVEATHQQVAGYVARLLDGRIRIFEKRWYMTTETGWQQITDARVCSIVRGIICRPDPDSTIPRRIIPVTMRKVTIDDHQALVSLGIAELRGDMINGFKPFYRGTNREVTKVLVAADQWAEVAKTARDIVSELAGRATVVLEEGFDLRPFIINARGTILDLSRNMARVPPRPLSRRDLVTRTLGCSFDPAAQCPQWRKFIDEVTAYDPAYARYLQKIFGMALVGKPLEQQFFVFHGPRGSNGKSVTVNVVRRVFGTYGGMVNTKLIEEQEFEGHPTIWMALRGLRLASMNETKSNARWDANAAKRLASDEPLKGYFMRQDEVQWDPTHTLIVTTNHRARLRGSDPAYHRRHRECPFTQRWYTPEDRDDLKAVSVGPVDRGLEDRLFTEEAAGILNWCLEGLMLYYAEGLEAPDVVKRACAEAQGEATVFGGYVGEGLRANPSAELAVKPVWKGWNGYREENSKRSLDAPTTRKDLIKMLLLELPGVEFIAAKNGHEADRFVGVELTAKGRVWAGLATGEGEEKPANVTELFPQKVPGAEEAGA